jgi:hypothetical protein
MTPAKRRSATPASQGPTRTAPDVPIVADPAPASPRRTKDGTKLLGPEGEPLTPDALATDASGDSTPPTQPDDRATTRSSRRPGGLYPLPVWPD